LSRRHAGGEIGDGGAKRFEMEAFTWMVVQSAAGIGHDEVVMA
jgi:hypothetical protein